MESQIHLALKYGSDDMINEAIKNYRTNKLNINIQDQDGNTALHLIRKEEILISLLNYKGVNVSIRNKEKNTPFHIFCQTFTSKNYQEPLDLFIKKGVKDLNIQNNNNDTPLHKAIIHNTALINPLLDLNVNVNILNNQGQSALHLAIECGMDDLVVRLIKMGADITLNEKTVLDIATESGTIKTINYLKKVQDIYYFFKSLDLADCWLVFVKNDIFMDTIQNHLNNKESLAKLGLLEKLGTQGLLSIVLEKYEMLKHQYRYIDDSSRGTLTIRRSKRLLYIPNNINSTGSEDWIIEPSELEYTSRIGQFSTYTEYKGLFKRKEVLIRVFKSNSLQPSEYTKELKVIGTINSPFVSRIYGVCLEPSHCLVLEYWGKENLYNLMNNSRFDFSWDRFFEFSMQITLGLQYLHKRNQQVLHRDLKSTNIILNDDMECKVSEYSNKFNSFDNKCLSPDGANSVGLLDYHQVIPPEILSGGSVYSIQSDIYNLGVIILELMLRVTNGYYIRPDSMKNSCINNITNINNDSISLSSSKEFKQSILSKCPSGVYQLYKDCCQKDPFQRLSSCDKVIESLNQLKYEYTVNKLIWNDLIKNNK
ncbi:hypothetical protein CYY_003972 [Polysphondylium violaceum]|uniref:non-specific serine/threonine protein kinase n=1 Tax=Polysphondylium violaceum TaxID=133409 RepID=A0A8J4PW05_9MYCE|nr:hypothetical protein CYY_003972 [Polysphondylium violaceum]